jgi:predicted nucleic acid-binding protein
VKKPVGDVRLAEKNRQIADRHEWDGLDTIIAAIAEANRMIVVTDNERDFAGVEFINPLRGAE